MNVKQLETITDQKATNLSHVQALINALGNPSEWIYEGEMNDCGAPVSTCACGHVIRYEFIIHHPDGRTNKLGSTCIEHYAAYNPESAEWMKKDYENYLNELATKKKEQKDKLQSEEVQKAKEIFDIVFVEWKNFINSKKSAQRGWIPYEFYGYNNHVYNTNAKIQNYARKSTMIQKYNELVEFMNKIMGK